MKAIKWAPLVAVAVLAMGLSVHAAFAQPDDFSDAPHHLAVMYEKGVGVSKDKAKAKALELYKLSADRGYDWGKKAYERLLRE